ncbi:MAG: TRAP transporter substrate-binding protein DctP [Spirochaetales bacterium]|nr:TRAP transporter substrate-binding protein DctP [Spirochaetales bacterium]
MKKVVFLCALLCMSAFLVFAGGSGESGAATADKPMTWRAQGYDNVGTARFDAVQYFCNKLKEASGGRLIVELYTAEALVPTMQALDGVKNGIVEAAFTAPDYQGGKEPMLKLQAYRPADPWSDYQHAEEFFERYEYLAEKAWTNLGVGYAGTVQFQPNEAEHSNKEIRKISDWQGVKMRTAGLGQELFTAMGASVVTMPMGDIYQAMKLNTIDAFEAGGYSDNYQNALHEVVKYNIEPALHCGASVATESFIITPSVWAKVPQDIKDKIPALAKDARRYSYEMLDTMNKEFKTKFEAAGVKTIILSGDEVAKGKLAAAQTLKPYWKSSALSAQFLDEYCKYLREKGWEDIAKVIESGK